jgi:hypothetical protein
MPLSSPPDTARNLQALAERWAPNTARERAGFQSWMLEFLEALGAERPLPPTPEHQFELPVRVVDREGREAVNFIDKTGRSGKTGRADRCSPLVNTGKAAKISSANH